jgi:two-component system nitrogen regulation sensor histidine kinase NtrY
MLKKRRFILFTFIAVLGLVLAANFLWDDRNNILEYERQIEQRVSEVIDQFGEDYLKLLMNNRADQQVTFSSLTIPTHHPFYLFSESGELLYWSDNEMIPTFDDFKRNRKFQLIENTKGVYLTQLRKLNRNAQGFWMVQVFSLYDNVEIQNEFLHAGPNVNIFGNERFVLSSEPQEGYTTIENGNGEYLFSILFRVGYTNAGQHTNHPVLVFFFSMLGLVLIIGGDFISTIWRKGRRLASITYTIIIMAAIRAMMIVFNFPQSFSSIKLFDPSQYAASVLNPSLGDLLLNVTCCFVVLMMILGALGRKRFLIRFLGFKRGYYDWIFLVLVYMISTALVALFFSLFNNIVNNSQWNLNILALPNFDLLIAISLVITFLAGAGYMLFTIIGLNLVLYKNPSGKAYALKVLIVFFLPMGIYLGFGDLVYMIPFLAHVILLVVIITFQLYNNLFRIRMNTFLTFFFGCMVAAIITGAAAYQNYQKEELQLKVRFAQQILLKEDVMAEFLISDVMDKVSEDIFIKKRLMDPLLSKEPIVQKIRKAYMINNFDQYDISIQLFNKSGENILNRETDERLDDYRFRYMNSDYATSHLNLFYIKDNDIGGENRFYGFVNLYDNQTYIGAVVIELIQRRIQSGSVFPKLLMDNKYAEAQNVEQFDYAIFRGDELQFSMGIFNYRSAGFKDIYSQLAPSATGLTSEGYHHLAVDSENEMVVVSSPAYPNKYILADVALFFVTYLIFTLLAVLLYSLLVGINNFRFNYATKLQFYLNFAFFFPMLIISVVTIGFLNRVYTEDLHARYFEKATIIRDNLSSFHESLPEIRMDQEDFSNEVYQLAGSTNTDINLYTPAGRLVATNQPNIFEKKILTDYINPQVYAQIIEDQHNHLILDEQVGSLQYKTVYLALRDKEKQQVLGIIAIPFFESEEELNQLIVDIFSNILNIFVFIFIVFLIISYFVSMRLTTPFKLLTQKIKATTLHDNEPMNWPAKDEIGMLVNEYNNMLFKLEASMKILASKEKESAWREMAKQVAHEIKNPLTPMKLTLQHMLRLQAEGKLDDPERLKKPVQTLINQVDVLSDIATSFSTFAKMPLPENGPMDFREAVVQAVELFKNHERGTVRLKDETAGELTIIGDAKLFGRVISNLIINGIQSVEGDKQAQIHVLLTEKDQTVKLEIRDNGKGVTEELREKIFVPNFSTKSEGSGLGLAIAKRGVETAGGKIWFTTKVGRGSSFFLAFPLLQKSAEPTTLS